MHPDDIKAALGQQAPPASIRAALAKLPDRERRVLEIRYGFDSGPRRTLAEVGQAFGVRKERARQIEHAAISRMARQLDATTAVTAPADASPMAASEARTTGRTGGERLRELLHRHRLAMRLFGTAVARTHGLDSTDGEALIHLAGAGWLTPGQLGHLLGLTSGGVTALLHRLRRGGWITQEPHPLDGRSIVVSATEQTVTNLMESFRALTHQIDQASALLSPETLPAVEQWLDQVVRAVETHADEARAAQRAEKRPEAPPHPGLWA